MTFVESNSQRGGGGFKGRCSPRPPSQKWEGGTNQGANSPFWTGGGGTPKTPGGPGGGGFKSVGLIWPKGVAPPGSKPTDRVRKKDGN